MDFGIAGKHALVIAGSRGIGAGVVTSLRAEGARVSFTSRHAPRDGPGVDGTRAYSFDTDDLGAIDDLVALAEADSGPIDILVLKSGGPASHEHPFDTTLSEWKRAHRSLVLSPFETLRRVVPGMAERGWGRVILLSSMAAVEPVTRNPLANAYRPAMISNLGLLSTAYAPRGVTFNTVIPGVIKTDRAIAGRSQEAIRASEALSPIGRMGSPEEVGAAVAFLASTQASYITGSQLVVDGGTSRAGF